MDTTAKAYRDLLGGAKEILLVEDNPGDVRLTREAFREGVVVKNLHVVGDGVEALSFLRREGQFKDSPRPDLILLDLNLPKKDGRQLLGEIKADPSLKKIPVLVLTTSQSETDIEHCYNLHVNCYLSKPLDIDEFFEIVESIEEFWLRRVKLPE